MRLVTAALLFGFVAAVAGQSADMRTRAEISNYEETSTYADVTRVIDGLAATSPLVHTDEIRPPTAGDRVLRTVSTSGSSGTIQSSTRETRTL